MNKKKVDFSDLASIIDNEAVMSSVADTSATQSSDYTKSDLVGRINSRGDNTVPIVNGNLIDPLLEVGDKTVELSSSVPISGNIAAVLSSDDAEDAAPKAQQADLQSDAASLDLPPSGVKNGLKTKTFDDSHLLPERRKLLVKCETRINDRNRTTIIENGRDLLVIKSIILDKIDKKYERGEWSKYLESTRLKGFSESSARNYMAAAIWIGKTPTVGVLAPGAMYEGANAPEKVQQEVIRLIEAKQEVTADDIRKLKKLHKPVFEQQNSNTAEAVNQSNLNDRIDAKIGVDDITIPDATASGSAIASVATAPAKALDEPLPVGSVTNANSSGPMFLAIDEDETVTSEIDEDGIDDYDRADARIEQPELLDADDRPSYQDEVSRAAVELVARLSEVFDDAEILDLLELWHKCSYASVRELLPILPARRS